MTEFMSVGLDKKQELDSIFKTENSRSADYCFGNAYMWKNRFEESYTVHDGRLIMLLSRREGRFFAYPVGTGDIKSAVALMREVSRGLDMPLRMCGVCKNHAAELEAAFPGKFSFIEDRDFSDYLYSAEKLSGYAGRELHAKRNFCNRFEAEYENAWRFLPLTRENISDCIALLDRWDREAEGEKTDGLEFERDAVMLGFESFEELELEGGVLYARDEPIGFTVGEKISDDTFCVHFEKAHTDIAGAYAMVCREFAKMIRAKHLEIRYVNREDDMGLQSLRRSKLSYKPETILMKYIAQWVEQ